MIDFPDHFLFFSFFLYFEICKYDKDKKYFLFPFVLEKWKIRLAEVCTDGEHTNKNVLKPSAERSKTAKIALHFTERPLTTVVTLLFAGSHGKLS